MMKAYLIGVNMFSDGSTDYELKFNDSTIIRVVDNMVEKIAKETQPPRTELYLHPIVKKNKIKEYELNQTTYKIEFNPIEVDVKLSIYAGRNLVKIKKLKRKYVKTSLPPEQVAELKGVVVNKKGNILKIDVGLDENVTLVTDEDSFNKVKIGDYIFAQSYEFIADIISIKSKKNKL